jgi:hypothetical protein
MSLLVINERLQHPFLAVSGGFPSQSQHSGSLQARSCMGSLQTYIPGHLDIGQRKQRHKLIGALDQPAMAHLAITELPFFCAARVFHFGAHMIRQRGVNDLQYLGAQVMLFEHVSKAQDADLIRNAFAATDAYKVTVETGLEQGFFGSQVRQTRPLLQAAKASHQCKIKRRSCRLYPRCVRRYQRQQFALRHDLLSISSNSIYLRMRRVLRSRLALFVSCSH